jgi:hypothetical protein
MSSKEGWTKWKPWIWRQIQKTTEAVEELQEVRKEEDAVETAGTCEDRCENQRRTVGYRTPLQRRTTDNVVQRTNVLEQTSKMF